jgi:hypothetical protein
MNRRRLTYKRATSHQPKFRELEKLPVFTLRRTSDGSYVMLSGPEIHTMRGRKRKLYCVRLGIDSSGTALGGFCGFKTETEAREYLRRHANRRG